MYSSGLGILAKKSKIYFFILLGWPFFPASPAGGFLPLSFWAKRKWRVA